MSLKNSSSDLDRLKELLLGDELEALAQIESKLKTLTILSDNPEEIKAKVLPFFDEMLLERLQDKGGAAISLLSDYLARIIAEASHRNNEALSQSLQGILSTAVSREIASNKDAMIDTLYPIMGGMVSKYVSTAIKELIENINRKIDDGLSMERYKRKIKSRVTGVSETELLLQEISEAHILSLFVIQKESGLLISEAHWRDNQISDPHMVASMASAIKDFINDWIQKSEKQAEVQLLSYGSSTLYIESAGSVYLVAFLNAEPDQEQRIEINHFFASLIKEYFDLFQNFDGDDSSRAVKSLTAQIQSYLDTQNNYPTVQEKRPKSNYARYFVLLLLTLLLIGILYIVKDSLTEYAIASEIEEKTDYTIDIDIDGDQILAEGSVSSFSDLHTIEKIISQKSQKSIVNKMTIPMSKIGQLFHEKEKRIDTNITQLSGHIKQLEEELREAAQTVETLNKKLTREEAWTKEQKEQLLLRKKKINELISLKENIATQLKNSFGHTSYFHPKNNTLVFSSSEFFPRGEAHPRKNAWKTIEATVNQYLTILLGIKKTKRYLRRILISGHTDSDGRGESNAHLAKERALLVKNHLSRMQIIQENGLGPLLTSTGYASQYRIMVNRTEDKNASRRVEIEFQLDEKKLEEDIKHLVNSSEKMDRN